MDHKNRPILLTFDLEEFDLPVEHGIPVSPADQMELGRQGMETIQEVLRDTGVPATLFTTANFALRYPARIASLAATHEIASHTFFHASFNREDLHNSRQVLEDIISKPVYGVRMPRMSKIEAAWIRAAGYAYDASVVPSWIPGHNRSFRAPRSCYLENGITRVPASVSANFRIPLFWPAFKNLPYSYFKRLALEALKKDGFLLLYFHPWEFLELRSSALPLIIRRRSGPALVEKLKTLVTSLQAEGTFMAVRDYLHANVDLSVRPEFKYATAAR